MLSRKGMLLLPIASGSFIMASELSTHVQSKARVKGAYLQCSLSTSTYENVLKLSGDKSVACFLS